MGDVADCEQIDANRADDGAAAKKFSNPGFTAKTKRLLPLRLPVARAKFAA